MADVVADTGVLGGPGLDALLAGRQVLAHCAVGLLRPAPPLP